MLKSLSYAFLLILAVSCPAGFTKNKTREIPLEVQSLSGCYTASGKIKLHRTLPSQSGRGNLVIEAENAHNLFFQEDVFARKAGAKADQLIQIKHSAADYKPQSDKAASGGKYIDYAPLAVYQFNIETPGKYYVWTRHWVPVKANWSYNLNIDSRKENINITAYIPAAKTWFWVKCPPVKLTKGNHSMSIVNLLNGKRLDAIVFSLDNNFNPARQPIGASTEKAINNGSITFKPVLPVGLKKWKKLACKQLNQGGKYEFYTLSGKKWLKLSNRNLTGSKPLTIKLEMTRVSNTAPVLSNVQAIYDFDSASFITLENKYLQLYFSRETGALSGIINNLTGSVYQPVGIKCNMFDILLKQPGNKKRYWVSQHDAELIKSTVSKNKLQLHWLIKKYKIDVVFNIALTTKELVKWDIKIINNNAKFDVLEVEAPKLTDLKISSKAQDDTLVWPFSAGEFISFPASKGEFSIAYPDHAGLAYVDLYNSKEGLYFASHDPFLVATHFISKANIGQDAIALSINRKHRIRPGTSLTYHFALAPHIGDWHTGARFYRNYFYSRYPVNKYAPWLRACDAWKVGGGAGHGGFVNRARDYTALINDYKRAAFYSLPYIQSWGSTFNGACPTYYLPRLDKGGEKLFTKMIEMWRDVGGQTGFYFHGNAVTPYYLLTDKYFTVKWDKYPKKYHPPTWEWYVKNKEYTSGDTAIDKAKLLKATASLNKEHTIVKKYKHGNQEERATGYMPMSWRSNAFPNYLMKWVETYVKDYHCNTAYLDTFAFRNDRADFNPYLKLHGEGDKPMYKMAFLKKMMRTMRTYEPDFCALTEGVADVFGTKLYFLLSGFARNPSIYRYTLPDQIFFQGSCNALWSRPLTRKSITQSFMVGNRFDLVRIFPHTYYMLLLRQHVSPFLNYAVFNDTEGITLTDPDIQAFNHVTMPSTNEYINNSGSKAVAFTIANPHLKTAILSYTLPQGFTPRNGYIFRLYKAPEKLKFTNNNGNISFAVPKTETSCVVLCGELQGPQCWTATLRQSDYNTIDVELFNFSKKPETFTITSSFTKGEKIIKIPGGTLHSIKLRTADDSTEFKLANVIISSSQYSRKYVTALGRTGRTIPRPPGYKLPKKVKPKKIVKHIKGKVVLKLDFESDKYSKEKPYKDNRCFKLAGNGKYIMKKFPLQLEKNTKYKISLAIRKGFDVSLTSHHNNVVVANYSKDKKLKLYINLGTSTPRDNKWHILAGTFTTDDKVYNSGLYFYNKNSKDNIWIDAIRIEKISQ
jgi:hypothetical protein